MTTRPSFSTWTRAEHEAYRSRVRGCLLGGALGDALGAPVEFLSLSEIRSRHGPAGVVELTSGLVTDDTQMTLFTVEGMIRASLRWDRGVNHEPSQVRRSYLGWLATQERSSPPADVVGWLGRESWLYAQRAPGNACLSGLRSGRTGTLKDPVNPDSKGCGAVMRSAPFGLIAPRPYDSPERCFQYAIECAVLTHGHPTGYLAAGMFAAIIRCLVEGSSLAEAVDRARAILVTYEHHEETLKAVDAAVAAASAGTPSAEQVEQLGGGWIAEEALAIGLYCAMVYLEPMQFRDALLLAVNHSGDADSTGSIAGNLLGTLHGETALPPAWVFKLEGRGTILTLADDFALEQTQSAHLHGDYGPDTGWHWRF
ncbi:ADP-ribosylglycohydrolase family protein [Tenggerimyces flavus]|uniref:ADP-ribosylglycohydrolase family protein n=1 Tax=Tenggerimyces flavus TaxID=1708749 RepID=A0ABV7YQT7_9ACTN|nr:ADP-ribosylglycohydrolase family protein [Tenggerimyces flavus]MBM7786330.1 ADP-ribosylglycohydrolase [Tenggerimyces flavus]